MKCLNCLKNEEELNQVGPTADNRLKNTQQIESLECYGQDCASKNVTKIQKNVESLNVLNRKSDKMFTYSDNLLLSKQLIKDITSNAFTPFQHQTKIVIF